MNLNSKFMWDPLARFTEKEERRWCEEYGEEEDEAYMGDGLD